MLNKNKIILGMLLHVVLVFNLLASDTVKISSNDFADFTLPPQIFDDIGGPVIKQMSIVTEYAKQMPSKIQDFVVDHPKESAIFAGVLMTGVGLGISEMLQRNRESLDILKARGSSGILNMPFQHGFKPYFLGTAVGCATGVGIKRMALSRKSDQLYHVSQKLKAQTALIKKNTEKHLAAATKIQQETVSNHELARQLVQNSAQISVQANQLKSGLINTNKTLETCRIQIDKVGQSIERVETQTGELSSSISDLQQKFDQFKDQDQRTGFVQQTSFLADFYGFNQININQACLTSAIKEQKSGLNCLAQTGEQTQVVLNQTGNNLKKLDIDIAAISDSVIASRHLVKGIKNKAISCTGGAGEE